MQKVLLVLKQQMVFSFHLCTEAAALLGIGHLTTYIFSAGDSAPLTTMQAIKRNSLVHAALHEILTARSASMHVKKISKKQID